MGTQDISDNDIDLSDTDIDTDQLESLSKPELDFFIDPSTTGEKSINTIKTLFDSVLQVNTDGVTIE